MPKPRDTAPAQPVMLVCSCGGHLLQMMALRDAWEGFPRVWVTFDKPDSNSLLRGERVVHAYGPTNRSFRNFLRNLKLAWRVLGELDPAAMMTTGAGLAVPFAWIGRLRRIPIVYVESFTRIDRLSLSGRLIAPIASRLYVQWPELAQADPRTRYAGHILSRP